MPERPGYFALDAGLNRSAPLADLAVPVGLTARTSSCCRGGVLVLDTRPSSQFGAHYRARSIRLSDGLLRGQGGSSDWITISCSWAKIATPCWKRTRLARVGLNVVGYLEDRNDAWLRGLPVGRCRSSPWDLRRAVAHLQVIDVRQPEWEAGHIAQAVLKPLPS